MSYSKLSDAEESLRLLQKTGRNISAAVNEFLQENSIDDDFEWEFNLIDDAEQANAWCMPGGKIAFYTGILDYTQDEAGMATVMGDMKSRMQLRNMPMSE